MDDYKIIVEQEHSTVMAHYDIPKKDSEGYQSEAKLEAAFIKQLQSQGYEYVKVKDEAGLLVNMRHQLELLNDVSLSDAEWKRLLPMISNEQMTILDKTEMIQGKGFPSLKQPKVKKAVQIQMIPKGSTLEDIEADEGVRRLVHNMMALYEGTTIMNIVSRRRGVQIRHGWIISSTTRPADLRRPEWRAGATGCGGASRLG